MRNALVLAGIGLVALAGCKKSPPEESTTGLAGSSSAVATAVPSAPVDVIPFDDAGVERTVNPNHLPPYTGAVGSLEGTVTVTGDPSPPVEGLDFSRCPDPEHAKAFYGRAFRDGPPRPDGSRPLADAIVVVTGYSGAYIPEGKESKLVTIKDCAFSTRTVDLTFGQRIDVQSFDEKGLYGPELASSPMPALMVPPPRGGAPIAVFPKKPGYTTLYDRLGHKYMVADVYVLGQPLHTVTDEQGHYRIDGIPVGKLDVNVRLKAINHDVTKSVEIVAGVVKQVDLNLEYRTLPTQTPGKTPSPDSRVK